MADEVCFWFINFKMQVIKMHLRRYSINYFYLKTVLMQDSSFFFFFNVCSMPSLEPHPGLSWSWDQGRAEVKIRPSDIRCPQDRFLFVLVSSSSWVACWNHEVLSYRAPMGWKRVCTSTSVDLMTSFSCIITLKMLSLCLLLHLVVVLTQPSIFACEVVPQPGCTSHWVPAMETLN